MRVWYIFINLLIEMFVLTKVSPRLSSTYFSISNCIIHRCFINAIYRYLTFWRNFGIIVVCLPVILKVTKVTFMLKSENYGIHQIKVQNILRSGERGPPVLSGHPQPCGKANTNSIQNLFLRVGCGSFKRHPVVFRHSTAQ